MKPSIGIIHPYFNSLGGSEQVCYSLMNELSRLGFHINLYTISKPELCLSGLQINTPKINMIFQYLPSRLKKLVFENKLLKMLNTQQLIIITSGSLFNIQNNRKMVLYCNSTFQAELDYLKRKHIFPKSLYEYFLKLETKKRLANLRRTNIPLITNSKYTHDFIESNFGQKSDIVYPPVDTKKHLISYHNPKENMITVVSRASPEKNLLECINILKDLQYNANIISSYSSKEQTEYFKKMSESIKYSSNIHLYDTKDVNKDEILGHSKVYLQTSVETFGISVIEAICSGCIPVVPNHSANIETVPFPELRYNTQEKCIMIINDVMNGKYDYLKPKLLEHTKQFSIGNFQSKMIQKIQSQIISDNLIKT